MIACQNALKATKKTVVAHNDLETVDLSKALVCKYRTRANKGRSLLVAAPLKFQAKSHFICLFYVVIRGPKT